MPKALEKKYLNLSYDIAVSQWIMSCHKHRTTTCVIALWRIYVTSLTKSVSTPQFLIEIMFIFKAIKSYFKGSYDKQNLTLVVTSYEIYETSLHVRMSCFCSLFTREANTGLYFYSLQTCFCSQEQIIKYSLLSRALQEYTRTNELLLLFLLDFEFHFIIPNGNTFRGSSSFKTPSQLTVCVCVGGGGGSTLEGKNS